MSQVPLPGVDDPIVGSTMTPSVAMTPRSIANETITNILNLRGTPATEITHDPNSESAEALPSMLAIHRKFSEIADLYDKAEQLLNKFSNPYVISDPLCDPHFLDKHWGSDRVSFDNGTANIIKNSLTSPYAYLSILPTAFTVPGWYYCEIYISKMSPGSKIEIRTETDILLMTIDTPGIYKFRYQIDRPSVAVLYFYVTELADGGEIILEHIYFHSVRASLNRYMVFIQEEAATGGSSFASMAQVTAACLNALNDAKTYTNNIVANIDGIITTHIGDFLNPHQVSWDQTGAAALVHTHTPAECGAAPLVHTHDFSGLDLDELQAHLIDTANKYHQVTKDQVGLGNIPNAITDATNDSDSEKVASAKAVATLSIDLATHMTDTANPHLTTKDQVGLGNVDNFFTATLEETIDGTSIERFINPAHIKQAISQWVGSGIDFTKMQPHVMQQFELMSGETRKIPILPNKIYQIQVSTGSYADIGTLKYQFEDETGTVIGPYKNSYIYATPDVAPYINWKTESSTTMSMLPTPYGVNYGNGTITLDTNSLNATSVFNGRIVDTTTLEFLNEPLIPTQSASTIVTDSVDILMSIAQSVKSLAFINTSASDSVLLSIYEMMPVHTHPSVVVDATPVGHMSSTLGINPQQPGWSYIDGSELDRTKYQKLWDYVQSQGLAIPDIDWLTKNTAGEDIPHYSDGNGSTTFRIPKIQDLTQPWILNVIKVKDVTIPADTQVLFRLIMDEFQNP